LHSLPGLEVIAQLETGLKVQCGALAPHGGQLALGCGDGLVRFLSIEGVEQAPLVVKVTQSERRTASTFQRLLGRATVTPAFHCICPVCQQSFELPSGHPGHAAPCPSCHRPLRVGTVALAEQPA
jgi:hypothetical protein